MRYASIILVSIVLTLSVAACAPAPTPTATPPLPTATLIPRTATSAAPTAAPSATPIQSAPSATAAASSNLRTDTIEFLAPLSEDDADPLIQGIQNLSGVKDAQTNGQQMQITYDPTKINIQQIIAAIENYGFEVKK
jgi:copper chaperone CopZ